MTKEYYFSIKWNDLTLKEVLKEIYPFNLELSIPKDCKLAQDIEYNYDYDLCFLDTEERAKDKEYEVRTSVIPGEGKSDHRYPRYETQFQISFDMECTYYLRLVNRLSEYRLYFEYSPNTLNSIFE